MKKFILYIIAAFCFQNTYADVPGNYVSETDVTIVLPKNLDTWKFYYRIYRPMTMNEYRRHQDLLKDEREIKGNKSDGRVPIGEWTELVGKLNKVTIPGGNYIVPDNIKIFARDSVTNVETNLINEFRGDIEKFGDSEKFIVIDSISAQTLFFHSYNKIEYQIYLNKLKTKEIKPTKIKPDTGSYNNGYRTEIKYYKAGSTDTTNFTTLFILIIIAMGSLILFIVRRYYKYKRD